MRLARAWLTRAFEPGSAAVHDFVAVHGPVTAVRLLLAGQAPAEIATTSRSWPSWRQAELDVDLAAAAGARLVIPEDPDWPHHPLQPLAAATAAGRPDLAPPLALWIRGDWPLTEALARCVCLTGSRAATGYGQQVAADLGYGLAGAGWTVVAGAAYGIDGAAHRGALAAGGVTAAVLAGGVDRPYPSGHTALIERIAADGLLVSEAPPGSHPTRRRFLQRGRLCAGLSAGTVVVEAGARSSALATAGHARQLGRACLAVPGPVTSIVAAGTHLLLREQRARLVTCLEHVLADLDPTPEAGPAPAGPDGTGRLDPTGRRVLAAIPDRGASTPDRIAAQTGVPVLDVLRSLPALEHAGLVEPTGHGWRLRPPAGGG